MPILIGISRTIVEFLKIIRYLRSAVKFCEILAQFWQMFCENACLFHLTPPTRRFCPKNLAFEGQSLRPRGLLGEQRGREHGGRPPRLGSRLKILSFSPNLERLVLRCIDSYDSESRRIFSDFSRSTRFSPLRTALNPKFQ